MKRNTIVCTAFCGTLLLVLLLGSCKKEEGAAGGSAAEPVRTELALGTICSISLFDEAKENIYKDIFARIREIEERMSVNIPSSDVSQINAAAGKEPVKVNDDVFEVIERSLYFAEISGGAFDPTVGPLVSLWKIGSDFPYLPTQEEIDTVLPLINWRDVELDKGQKTVFLKRPGMALDLGAIAKGYATDEAVAIIKKARIKKAIVDLGGNIMTFGEKDDKSPWRVGLQNPLEFRGSYLGIVSGPAMSFVTSGVYERFFEVNGQRYHHILSTADGYPCQNGLQAVTIITANSMDADGFSTSVFAMGYEKGRELVESIKGVEAVFVFDDMSVRMTDGTNFVLTDDGYTLVSD